MTGPFLVVIAGVACTAVGLGWLLLMHARNRIDLVDVVTEFDTDRGVRAASIKKIGEATALGASTFYLVYDVMGKGGSEGLLFAYLTCWCARYAFGRLIQAKAGAIDAAAGK